MTLLARSVVTDGRRSRQVGFECGRQLAEQLGAPPRVFLTYLTINHDQAAFLAGLREATQGSVPIVGCSAQGIMGRGTVREEGYGASVLALGGDVDVACACVDAIADDPRARGRALGERLRGVGPPPRIVVLHWDPLCGADVGLFLEGLFEIVACPILGGAASHHYEGRMHQTFVHFEGEVASGRAVALALHGDFAIDMAVSQGCSPFGVELTVTRAEGNRILELDGQPALDVWTALTMSDRRAPLPTDHAAMAIGVLSEGATVGDHLIRAAFVLDVESRSIVVGAAIPTGTRVMLHQRTLADVLDGSERLGRELVERLRGRRPVAVLGFECGARTGPFLGEEATLHENLSLQRVIAPDAAWVGAMMWGELYPVGGRPGFHNYAYPLVALSE